MTNIENDRIRGAIRREYAATALSGGCGCGCRPPQGEASAEGMALRVGYRHDDLEGLPDGANMGLGCGNPLALARLEPGQTVVDLGSGGGFDCFLAARKVGPAGRVIGVDMTPEMVEKARRNAAEAVVANVEFRLGEIEHLPVADGAADWVISNCVINLSPDKGQVFAEAYRVLKPGGRLAVADIVAVGEMPESLRSDVAMLASCVSGAETAERLTGLMRRAGFSDVRVAVQEQSRAVLAEMFPGRGLENLIASARIEAVK